MLASNWFLNEVQRLSLLKIDWSLKELQWPSLVSSLIDKFPTEGLMTELVAKFRLLEKSIVIVINLFCDPFRVEIPYISNEIYLT